MALAADAEADRIARDAAEPPSEIETGRSLELAETGEAPATTGSAHDSVTVSPAAEMPSVNRITAREGARAHGGQPRLAGC